MAVRVLVRRKIPRDKEKEAQGLIGELRRSAMGWPGYISGETLRNVRDPEDYLVISTWQTLETWEKYLAESKRSGLQAKIVASIGKATLEVYDYPEPLMHPESMYF